MNLTRAEIIHKLTHTTCIPVGDGLYRGMFRCASQEEATAIADTLEED